MICKVFNDPFKTCLEIIMPFYNGPGLKSICEGLANSLFLHQNLLIKMLTTQLAHHLRSHRIEHFSESLVVDTLNIYDYLYRILYLFTHHFMKNVRNNISLLIFKEKCHLYRQVSQGYLVLQFICISCLASQCLVDGCNCVIYICVECLSCYDSGCAGCYAVVVMLCFTCLILFVHTLRSCVSVDFLDTMI